MAITKEQWNNLVKLCIDNPCGVAIHPMEKLNDGRELCLVMGFQQGYDKGERYQMVTKFGEVYTLCARLAVNIDDLQCDYDVDWYQPWNKENGDIWDTDMAVNSDSDVNWYNDQAKSIKEGLDKGILEVY